MSQPQPANAAEVQVDIPKASVLPEKEEEGTPCFKKDIAGVRYLLHCPSKVLSRTNLTILFVHVR